MGKKIKTTVGGLKKLVKEAVGAPPANGGRTLTVTLDLDALAAYAKEVADENDGTLESSSGMTTDDLDRAWEAMSTFFHGPNQAFSEAMSEAITVLQDAESRDDEGDEDEDY